MTTGKETKILQVLHSCLATKREQNTIFFKIDFHCQYKNKEEILNFKLVLLFSDSLIKSIYCREMYECSKQLLKLSIYGGQLWSIHYKIYFIIFVRIKCFKTIEKETLNVFLSNAIVVILRWRDADQKALWCKVNIMQNDYESRSPIPYAFSVCSSINLSGQKSKLPDKMLLPHQSSCPHPPRSPRLDSTGTRLEVSGL